MRGKVSWKRGAGAAVTPNRPGRPEIGLGEVLVGVGRPQTTEMNPPDAALFPGYTLSFKFTVNSRPRPARDAKT